MSDPRVVSVYDQLVGFEAPRHAQAYPVHKPLAMPGGGDIYDHITQQLTLPPQPRILDAGCGSGFGTRRLAMATGGDVLGISVSAQEIDTARKLAQDAVSEASVRFAVADFDGVEADQYDLIVAVESLKHSPDLARSLSRLVGALRWGGQLIVVDDVLTGSPQPQHLTRLTDAWALAEVYRREHFRTISGALPCAVEDLTDFTVSASRGRLWLRGRLLTLARVLRPRLRELSAIFAAGLDLEMLYRQGHMRYLMMRWSREPA